MSTWTTTTFSDAIVKNTITRWHQINTSEIKKAGKIPVIDQGQDFIAGYSDEEQKAIKHDVPHIIFGDHTRIFKYVDFPYILGADGTKVLTPNTRLFNPKFLYYFFRSLNIPSRGYNRHFKILKEQKIAQPPLSEQQTIATILSKIQEAIENQDKIIKTTIELKKSLMKKIFSEGLNGEQLKQTEIGKIPKSWEVINIGEVCDVKGGKRLPKGKSLLSENTGLPYIRVSDFSEYSVDLSDIKYLTPEIQKTISRYTISTKDVFISIAGSIGFVGIIPPELEGANLTENAAKLCLKTDKVRQKFLMYWLASDEAQMNIKLQTVKNAQPKLALARIQQIPIAIPIIKEQDDIIEVFDTLVTKIKVAKQKKQILENLFKSMLNNLMSGKIRVHPVR